MNHSPACLVKITFHCIEPTSNISLPCGLSAVQGEEGAAELQSGYLLSTDTAGDNIRGEFTRASAHVMSTTLEAEGIKYSPLDSN